MAADRRWVVRDRYDNDIYLTQERWKHITEAINHPEMSAYGEYLKETVQSGKRKQDPLNPQKYFYTKSFDDLGTGELSALTESRVYLVKSAS